MQGTLLRIIPKPIKPKSTSNYFDVYCVALEHMSCRHSYTTFLCPLKPP